MDQRRETEEEASWLLFELGKVRLATDLEPVVEVIPITRLCEVPLAPPLLAGLVNLRGAVVPAVDLGILLGLPNRVYDHSAGLVLGDAESRMVLLVGKIIDLVGEGSQERVGSPEGLPEAARPFVIETTRDGVLLLDLQRVTEDPRLEFEPARSGGLLL